MSRTEQPQAVAGSPTPRKDWELFWRIIAGLMVLVIGWVLWVMYQIAPRSVATPLAYATRTRPIGTGRPLIGAPSAPQPAAEATGADAAQDQAQAVDQPGANRTATDVGAVASEKTEPRGQGVGLRLATEISMPAAEKQGSPKTQ